LGVVVPQQCRDIEQCPKITAGQLGAAIAFAPECKSRDFASGDRVILRKNACALGVKNGSLGTVENVDRMRMAVQFDTKRSARST